VTRYSPTWKLPRTGPGIMIPSMAGGGQSGRRGHHGPGAADSDGPGDPDLGVEECLRCRGCKRRFATASALRRHTSHRHLRNSECAEQKRKNPRLLISSWKPGPAHRSDGTLVEDEHAALALAGDDLMESILLADNADEPADAAPSQVTLLLFHFQVQVSRLRVGPGLDWEPVPSPCAGPGPLVPGLP